jgi:hypothetical protein
MAARRHPAARRLAVPLQMRGKAHEMGLGGDPALSRAEAREEAEAARRLLARAIARSTSARRGRCGGSRGIPRQHLAAATEA